jgi:hypothetical protein
MAKGTSRKDKACGKQDNNNYRVSYIPHSVGVRAMQQPAAIPLYGLTQAEEKLHQLIRHAVGWFGGVGDAFYGPK